MQIHANHVSASVAGDYYQVLFEANEDSSDPDSPYLLIQRQFEMPDDGECYVETHNADYIGHFRLRRIEFSQTDISIEIDRPGSKNIQVTFTMTTAKFEEVAPVLRIISGEMDPYVE